MDAKNLASLWSAPDNSRLTAKQSSFRLPVHVAAKLAALADIYPQKSKTQIVGDLLAVALAEVEKGLPAFPGRFFDKDDDGEEMYEATGPVEQFRTLSNKYYAELESELGNTSPGQLYQGVFLVRKDEK
jgi:hypothetical protein